MKTKIDNNNSSLKDNLKKKITTFQFTKKHAIFIILFALLVFIGNRINFSPLVGAEKQYFTVFQFFGPIAGAFLGPVFGAISVLFASVSDYIISGKAFTLINVIRLLPMLFAAYYFGSRRKWSGRVIGVVIPLMAIIIYNLHPVARQAWIFSLYWLIPIAIALLPIKYGDNLVLKSFGATFTAHAVGSAAWAWTVPMTPEAWLGLIPVVIYERTLFALGIVGSYVGMNALLCKVVDWFKVPEAVLHIDRSYLLGRLFKAKSAKMRV